MREVVKLIVAATKPEDVVKCVSIVSKVRRYVQKYVGIQILFSPNVEEFKGIAVEDETIVECGDEEESIEQIIDGISRVVSRRRFIDIAVAAGANA